MLFARHRKDLSHSRLMKKAHIQEDVSSPMWGNKGVQRRAKRHDISLVVFPETQQVELKGDLPSLLHFLHDEQRFVEPFRWEDDRMEYYLNDLILLTTNLVEQYPLLVFSDVFVACKRMFHDYYGDLVVWDDVLNRAMDDMPSDFQPDELTQDLMKEMALMGSPETERRVLARVFEDDPKKITEFQEDWGTWIFPELPRTPVSSTVNELFPYS